ncbi:MAG: DUF86 domain-containing protein [Trueperaceae bacterium]|nr:DUF86 domain-containing protein [Trueperaceae bacterium]
MSRSVEVLLGEIVIAIDLLRRYTAGMDYDAFRTNVEKQDSVVRRLEVIGEAVKGIPSEVRAAYPEVPWRDIAGARDVLLHEYFRVDLARAWNMVQKDLPVLEVQVHRMLAELGASGG